MRRSAIFAAALTFAVAGAAAAIPPLQPKFDPAGNFTHEPGVALSLVAISPTGVTLECRRADGPAGPSVWRERYEVRDGKLMFVSVITEHDVPAQAAHTEWQETMVSEAPPPATSPAKVGGTDLRGAAIDPRWKTYPEYMQAVLHRIQTTWDHERITQKLNAKSGDRVSVKFVLDAHGQITRVSGVEFSPGTADAAVRACILAITSPAPYPPWTDPMIATLGGDQSLSLAFYYP
ncbi:MAG TPA: hypothetical protein VGL42_13905 [Opitutaceae bacterium]|jgi:hypothetical protein